MKPVVSSMFAQQPVSVVNIKTNKHDHVGFKQDATNLIEFVLEQTKAQNRQHVITLLETDRRRLAAAEWGRQNGIGLVNPPAQAVLSKSRVEKLMQHKTVSEILSYVNNPNPRKQPPTFSPKINLGAVDKQMCELYRVENQLVLVWKCWNNTYQLTFNINERYQNLAITKFSLPTVSVEKGEIIFRFSFEEQPLPQKQTGRVAGLDLGRVEPFVLSILSPKKRVAATFFASPGLKQVNAKRERLLKETNHIWVKEQHYTKLGLEDKAQVLKTERSFKRSKIKRLGKHIARKAGSETSRILALHEVELLHLENLSWVGSRGGKWNHSQQQEQHQHAAARKGVKTKFVNPKNTSQYCWDCKKPIVHNIKHRTVFCQNCKTTLPRDVNSANAIAKNINKTYPGAKRASGDNRSPKLGQVVQPLMVDESRRKSTPLSDNTPYLTKSTT